MSLRNLILALLVAIPCSAQTVNGVANQTIQSLANGTVINGDARSLRNAPDLFAAQKFLPGTQPATW
jgi:hypothetical protein